MLPDRDRYGLRALLNMLIHMDGNLGFDPINQRLKWAVRRAEEYVRAGEHSEAVSCLRQVAEKMVKEAKVEVNTGLTQLNKLPRITLDLFTPKANDLTHGLGPTFLSLFEYAIANVAPTRVQIGEDREHGIIVLVFDRLECSGLTIRDLSGTPHRAHVRIPAIDIAGHGTVATGANLQVRHASWALAEVGLFEFNPHGEDALANATFQIHTGDGWSKPSTDFSRRIGNSEKVRIIYRRLPEAIFARHIDVPEWVSTLFTDLGNHAVPQLADPDSLHPGEEAVYQFGGGIEDYGPRSQYVMYAGKATTIPQKSQQPVTYFIFHSALGKKPEEYVIAESKLRLRLRMNKDVRRLIPRPVGVAPTGKQQKSETVAREFSKETELSKTVEPVLEAKPERANAGHDSNEAVWKDLLGLVEGLQFKVADQDRVFHDVGVDGVVLEATDPSFRGFLATVREVGFENDEVTVHYHLTVRQDEMLHTTTRELTNAHRAAVANMSACKLSRFEFIGKPIQGGPRDARDYKINLMMGRELTVKVTYQFDSASLVNSN